jgi:hypothetical protein
MTDTNNTLMRDMYSQLICDCSWQCNVQNAASKHGQYMYANCRGKWVTTVMSFISYTHTLCTLPTPIPSHNIIITTRLASPHRHDPI